jgi:hypothetical protein
MERHFYLVSVSVVFLTLAVLIGAIGWKFYLTVYRPLLQAFGG